MDFILMADNRICLIDEEDSDLKEFGWFYHNRYVKRRARQGEGTRNILLHRVILERKLGRPIRPNYFVDHRNGNTCDNRRSNLREATPSENSANTKPKGTSKYRGVGYRSDSDEKNRKRLWRAEVYKNGKRVFIKFCLTEEEAARVYDEQAKIIHGEFARLNFPPTPPV